MMDADGRNKLRITNLKGNEAKPAWSPDSKAIAFLCSGCEGTLGSDLYLIHR
jgi:Tol biopolymer transport system component